MFVEHKSTSSIGVEWGVTARPARKLINIARVVNFFSFFWYSSTSFFVFLVFSQQGSFLLRRLWMLDLRDMVLQHKAQRVIMTSWLRQESDKQTRIAHFQKGWKPGATVGARLIMGSFGGSMRIVFHFVPPNDPMTERAPILVPGYHSFWKWAMAEA